MNWQEYSSDNQPKDYEPILFCLYELKRTYLGFFTQKEGDPLFFSLGLAESDDGVGELATPINPEDFLIGWSPIQLPNDDTFPNFKRQMQQTIDKQREAEVLPFRKSTP